MSHATYRRALDTVYKNVLRKPNPYEVLFKDISKFDVQNPITGSLLCEVESAKLTDSDVRTFLGKTPEIRDIELQERLKKLQNNNNDNNNDGDNDNNDNGGGGNDNSPFFCDLKCLRLHLFFHFKFFSMCDSAITYIISSIISSKI